MTRRYAIYWAPPQGSALARIGEAWLGRSAETGRRLDRLDIDGLAREEHDAIVAEPRRYGLHATLKPPFRLAEQGTEAELSAALTAFASRTPSLAVPPLRLHRIGRFIALVPTAPTPAVNQLAADCVEHFDRFRAPLDRAEVARRHAAPFTATQEANLVRWGYPYVMDEFRFHVTLTSAIDEKRLLRVEPILASLFAPALGAPVEIRELALFVEPEAGAQFRLAHRIALLPEA